MEVQATHRRGFPQRQPAKGDLVLLGITNRSLARETGLNEHYIGRALNGWVPVPEKLRDVVMRLTGRPEAELFVAVRPTHEVAS